ncbi:MAG: hypothetical protein ACFWUC_05865 [Oscillospiraceae bacterium]|jgi:hypothetical protein
MEQHIAAPSDVLDYGTTTIAIEPKTITLTLDCETANIFMKSFYVKRYESLSLSQ